MNKIKLGIVGSCGRGSNFKSTCDVLECLEIHAVCDTNEEALAGGKESLGAKEAYVSYDDMLAKSELEAVIIATPMPLHVPQSIAALERDIHVLCEVPVAVNVDECKDLVRACNKSQGIFMMAENYIYMQPNQIVKDLVRQGLFGTPYYAEGEYIHDVKEMSLTTPWRRHWQMGIDGITYGTHSLGPILQWMPGDRVVKVCCEAAGVRQTDTEGKPFAQAASTMLCKTEKGALIKIRVDLVSDRPHAGTNYQLQGTDGCYESSRGGRWDKDKIWPRGRDESYCWRELSLFSEVPELAEKYLPEKWRKASEVARRAGHGGGDYFELLDFIDAIQGKCPPAIGIHEAMDMTLPGLISQQSIQQDGAWLPVPDSRGVVMGLVLILLTGLAWGGIGIVLGLVAKRKFDVLTFITVATVLSSVGAWIFLVNWSSLLAGQVERPGPLILILSLAGMAGGMGMLYLQKSMTGGAAAWTVGQSAMVIPFLAGSFFLEKPYGSAGGVGVAATIFSLSAFAKGNTNSNADSSVGTHPWLRYALTAFVLLGIQQTFSSIPSSWESWSDAAGLRVPLALTTGALPLLVMAAHRGRKPNCAILRLAASYAVLVVIGQFLLFTAMDQLRQEERLSLAFPLALGTCIVIVALWDVFKWKRRLNRLTMIGIALGFAGVILVAL